MIPLSSENLLFEVPGGPCSVLFRHFVGVLILSVVWCRFLWILCVIGYPLALQVGAFGVPLGLHFRRKWVVLAVLGPWGVPGWILDRFLIDLGMVWVYFLIHFGGYRVILCLSYVFTLLANTCFTNALLLIALPVPMLRQVHPGSVSGYLF